MINEIAINKYNREILFHILILFIASTGAFLKISNFFDYILIISILIFCRNRSLLSTYYPLILFFWGFYSDLLIGYPLGYSGTIFLFFFLLKEVSYSLIDKKNIRSKSVTLNNKDMILLIKGAHGFKVLEKTEMLEVKQGPFTGDQDKLKLKKL